MTMDPDDFLTDAEVTDRVNTLVRMTAALAVKRPGSLADYRAEFDAAEEALADLVGA